MGGVDTFWSKVRKGDGCWEWAGASNGAGGYGSFSFLGRRFLAHRFAAWLTFGDIPTGMLVCHQCDNPKCVRPEHLFLGTALDNARDAVAKGRKLGKPWQHARLLRPVPPGIGANIRHRRIALGMTAMVLARAAGMTGPAVTMIETGKRSWPRMATLEAIARVLGCTAADLCEGVLSSSEKRSA